MNPAVAAARSQIQSDFFTETDSPSPVMTETFAAESTIGTGADADDDNGDERPDENEASIRETDDTTEAPEEFELDDDEVSASAGEDLDRDA